MLKRKRKLDEYLTLSTSNKVELIKKFDHKWEIYFEN